MSQTRIGVLFVAFMVAGIVGCATDVQDDATIDAASSDFRGCHGATLAKGSLSPASVGPGGSYSLTCDYGIATSSVVAAAGSGTCTFNRYEGTAVIFSCVAGTSAGTFDTACGTIRQYPDRLCTRSDVVGRLTVGGSSGASSSSTGSTDAGGSTASTSNDGSAASGVTYGTESAPWAATDPINTRYTGTPGASAGFDGSKFTANTLDDPWAIPIYYEREYLNKSGAVNLTVNANTNRGFGTSVSFWVPSDFHGQIGSDGYTDGEAIIIRADGTVVNFYGLGSHTSGTHILPTTAEFFNIAGIGQSGMKKNTNQFGSGFSGARAPQWAANTGIIDGYFMSADKPFRGVSFVVEAPLNTPSNCGHATYNYSGNFDGSGSNTGICEGQHFVIPASTPKPTTLTAEGSYLWDVFVQYGAYDSDSGSNQLSVARPGPSGTSVPQVTQAQVNNLNKDVAVLFNNLHYAND